MYGQHLPVVSRPAEDKNYVVEEEVQLILDAVKSKYHDVYLLFLTLWHAGLRISEALALTPANIRREPDGNWTLVVSTLKQRRVGTKRYKQAKSGREPVTDYIPIPSFLGKQLELYAGQKNLYRTHRIFPKTRESYFYQVKQCAKRAGLPNWRDISPHSFRHGMVHRLVERKVHPFVVARLARHRDIRTTLQYFQPTLEDLRAAIVDR